jgi:hypothetical protein
MKKVLLVLALISTSAFAYYEDPHQEFDMTHNVSNNMNIVFRQAADVNRACDAESVRRGFGHYTYTVDACSFWNTPHTECLVITEPTANFHTIGHEIRHCLQGQFHHGKDK